MSGHRHTTTRQREQRYFEAAVQRILADLNAAPTMHEIRSAAVKAFGVEISDVTGRCRWSMDRMARQAIMVLGARLTTKSIPQIKSVLGNVDNSSVILACRKYNDLIDRILGPVVVIEKPRRLTKTEHIDQVHYETLAKLIPWSIDDCFAHPEDIFPDWSKAKRRNRLVALRRRGYAEHELADYATYWRVTPLGRKAFDRMKIELPRDHESRRQGGGPVVDTLVPSFDSRPSTAFAEEVA